MTTTPAGCLHELVLAQVERSPEAIAVVGGGRNLSYGELGRRSALFAAAVERCGVTVGEPVCIWMNRSVDLVAGLLGVLRTGAAYLPIDPDMPVGRVAQLVKASRAKVLVTEDGWAQRLSLPEVRVLALGGPEYEVAQEAIDKRRRDPMVDPQSLVSIYYTSGSAGAPKGVASSHRGWVNRMRWMQNTYRLAPGEAVLQKTILSFVDAAVEIFWPLMVGGRVVMLDPGLHRDPKAILKAVIGHRIVLVNFVPSMLRYFLEEVEPSHHPELSQLRDVISCGEVLRPELLEFFYERLGPVGCRLNNQWGASEVSIDSTRYCCAEADGKSPQVPIGTPIDNTRVHVLDAHMEPVPAGTPGDLYLEGIGLARGYWNEPARTAEVFLPSPFTQGERLYRTGDQGLRRPDGELVYLGRADHQLKVRGIRIEPEEIEYALRGHPLVGDAIVTSFQPTPGDHRLAAYVLPCRQADPPTREELVGQLADRLPEYMIPASFVMLDAIPSTSSGKVDRRRLPPPQEGLARSRKITAPRNDVEAMLAEIWAEVLDRDDLDINDDFFGLGGHSLLATKVITRLRLLDPDIPLSLLYDRPTISGMAVILQEWLERDEPIKEGPVQ